MKFPVVIQPGEDGFFVADCPAFPGCMSQGRTEKEALKNIKEAIEGYLDVKAKLGRISKGEKVEVIINV